MAIPKTTLSLFLVLGPTLAACADVDDALDDDSSFRDVVAEQNEQHQTPAAGDLYGNATATHGTHAFVGAFGRGVGGHARAGSVETFAYDGSDWNYTGELTYAWPANDQAFGSSVDIYGNWAIVGMPGYWGNRGRALIYEYSNGAWQERQTLSPTGNGAAGDSFGYSVAISSTTAVVGVPFADDSDPNSGSIYVYRRSGSVWSQIQQFEASSPTQEGEFGTSVDISDNSYRIVVGAPNNTPWNDGNGDVEVFVRTGPNSTFVSEDELPGSGSGWGFGESVSISGDYLLIGEPAVHGFGQGRAKVYYRTGSSWNLQATLALQAPANGDWFGTQVAFATGEHAFVSAPGQGGTGRVYEYTRSGTTWSLSDDVVPVGAGYFGVGLAASTTKLVVGDAEYDNFEGRVHFYTTDIFSPPPTRQ